MPSVIATLQATIAELRAVNVDLRAVNVDLRAVNVELRAANARLEERVRDLETRVGQHSGNSSRPPSSDLPGTPKHPSSRPSGRGRGGQPGHVAHQRAMAPPERVDVVTDHWPLHCQACEACLTVLPQTPGAPDFVAHQVVTVHGVSWERATGDWSCHARCSLKAAWDQAVAGRSWGTAWPAMLAVQTPAR